jgi:hypothetical protein
MPFGAFRGVNGLTARLRDRVGCARRFVGPSGHGQSGILGRDLGLGGGPKGIYTVPKLVVSL